MRLLPKLPIGSSNLNKELEFKIFVGIFDHQITKGISKNNATSIPKIILSNTVLFSFISNPPSIKFKFIN